MKTITNETTDLTLGSDDSIKADYAALCMHALQTKPASGGFAPGDMRIRLRMLNLLDGLQKLGVISLENSDARVLLECIKATPWGCIHKDLVKFFDVMERELV